MSKQSDAKGVVPLGDRVLVKPKEKEEEKTDSGIIIPETASKESPQQGEVVAVGEGRLEDGKRVPVSVEVGDTVVFSKFGYDEINYDDEEYYIIKEDSILAVIK